MQDNSFQNNLTWGKELPGVKAAKNVSRFKVWLFLSAFQGTMRNQFRLCIVRIHMGGFPTGPGPSAHTE